MSCLLVIIFASKLGESQENRKTRGGKRTREERRTKDARSSNSEKTENVSLVLRKFTRLSKSQNVRICSVLDLGALSISYLAVDDPQYHSDVFC